MRDQIHSYNKDIDVGGFADGGFFQQYISPIHQTPLTFEQPPPHGYYKLDTTPPTYHSWEFDEETHSVNYPKRMRNLFQLMNISAGAPKACLENHPRQTSNCIFASNLLPTITSPFFILEVSTVIFYIYNFDFPLDSLIFYWL